MKAHIHCGALWYNKYEMKNMVMVKTVISFIGSMSSQVPNEKKLMGWSLENKIGLFYDDSQTILKKLEPPSELEIF